MLGAVKPLTTFLVAPFWGIIADQTGNKFRILYLTFLVSLLGQLLVAVRHDVNYILVMVFFTALVNAPVKSLMDSLVMEQLNDKSQYGRMRLWGQLGFGLGSSGVGVLLHRSQKQASLRAAAAAAANAVNSIPALAEPPAVDILSKISTLQVMADYADKFWQNLTGYKLLFSTYAALSIPTWWCLRAFQRNTRQKDLPLPPIVEAKKGASKTYLKIETKKSPPRTIQGLLLLLQNADAMLFFFLVLVVGISSGIIENFAYVRIREVGGSGREMGLSRLVSSVAGVPMFWWSGPLTEMFGADRILVWSMLSYVIRFLIYAVMQNAYQGLPAEALRGVVFAAFWSTSTIYAHRISPPGLDATMVRQ
jgi:MFS family permease